MSSNQPKFSMFRRRHFVLFKFQSRYALIAVLLSMFITAMMGLVIYRLFAGPDMESPFQLLEANGVVDRRAIWLVLGVGTLMLCAFIFFYAIVIVATHRVAGPILLMTRYMNELAQGRYPLMRDLRDSDELKEFFALFRATLDRLRAKEEEEARLLEQALTAVSALDSTTAGQDALLVLKRLKDSKAQSLADPPAAPQSLQALEQLSPDEVPVPSAAFASRR